MKRVLLGAAVVGLLVTGTALADVPPPKGQKRVALDHKITTDKEYPDYIFFTVIGGAGKGGGFKDNASAAANAKGVTEVKFDPKTPIEIKAEGRGAGIGRQGSLVAVPKDARKNYASDEEFRAAVRLGKVEGLLRAKGNLDAFTVVKDTDTRTVIVQQYKVEKVDPKEGLVLKAVKDEEKPKSDKQEPLEEPAGSVSPSGPAFPQVAGGLAAAGVVGFAGLWFARRRRPESCG